MALAKKEFIMFAKLCARARDAEKNGCGWTTDEWIRNFEQTFCYANLKFSPEKFEKAIEDFLQQDEDYLKAGKHLRI